MNIQTIISVRVKARGRRHHADYQRCENEPGDDQKVFGNVTDHSSYGPVGTNQTNPAAPPDDGF